MKFESSPFLKKTFSGTNIHGNTVLYDVIKASYDFNETGELRIADEQKNIVTHDHFYEHAHNSSVVLPEESMPFKFGSELLITGSITPRLNNCREQILSTKVLKGKKIYWQKNLSVFGKRHWVPTLTGAKITEPAIIDQPIALRYENAFGGNDYPSNPIGTGFTQKRANINGLALPQIEYSHARIQSPKSRPFIAGFQAIPKHWQPRLQNNQRKNLHERWQAKAHNLAPPDQQFSTLFQGDETLILNGFSEKQSPLTLNLPKPIKYQNRLYFWDTVSVNLDTRKLCLLTRTLQE